MTTTTPLDGRIRVPADLDEVTDRAPEDHSDIDPRAVERIWGRESLGETAASAAGAPRVDATKMAELRSLLRSGRAPERPVRAARVSLP